MPLERRERIGADLAQERVGLAIAAEQHVLAVVHALAGLAIGERRRAPAEPRRFLDDDDPLAGGGETDGGRSAREARADHDDVGGQRLSHASRHHVRIASRACAGRGTRITVLNTS